MSITVHVAGNEIQRQAPPPPELLTVAEVAVWASSLPVTVAATNRVSVDDSTGAEIPIPTGSAAWNTRSEVLEATEGEDDNAYLRRTFGGLLGETAIVQLCNRAVGTAP